MKIKITFTDGSSEEVSCYRSRIEDGVLRLRTSHDTSYRDDWEFYPLVNIRSWKRID